MKMKNSKTQGFTLIELIVVIAVLAILALLLVPQITGYVQASSETVCRNNMIEIQNSYLREHELDESVTLKKIMANANAQYLAGDTSCPKAHVAYSILYGYELFCLEHNITVSRKLTEYDEYIAREMLGLNELLDACGTNEQCRNDLINNRFKNNDSMRKALFEKNGNTWKEIDGGTLKKAGLTGTYYYQPFYAEGSWTEILFASTSNTANSGWNSDLYYFNGQWYKKKRGSNFSLPKLNNVPVETIRATFNDPSLFEKIN